MRLKTSYSAREVAGLTGLSARQLQGWDAGRIFLPAIAPRRTVSGGFTERRYTPVDVLELVALAGLRRRGFAPAALRQLMDALRDYFRRRLADTLDDAGDLRLLTDGRGLFLRTRQGHIFDLLSIPPSRSSPVTAWRSCRSRVGRDRSVSAPSGRPSHARKRRSPPRAASRPS